jgi:hypothetical protein
VKRLHVHVGVENLDQSILFYSTLFAAKPTVTKPDYAKWMLDDPRVNFAISSGNAHKGIEHLGIQIDEGATTCCYAKSEKSWIADPDGVLWEAFHTHGEATTYGGSVDLSVLSESASEGMCCVPSSAEPATAGCAGA